VTVLDQVKVIVAEVFGVDLHELTPETRFVEDLDESLELTETILACEEAFQIKIPDEDAAQLLTVGQLVAYVEARLSPETVWPPAPQRPAL